MTISDRRFDWFARLESLSLEPLIEELTIRAKEACVVEGGSTRGVNLVSRDAAIDAIAVHFISALYQTQAPGSASQYKVGVPMWTGNYKAKDGGPLNAKKIRYSHTYVKIVFECLKSLGWVDVTEHLVKKTSHFNAASRPFSMGH